MKIRIDGDTVEFEPETQSEAMELELLWKKMGSGLSDSKKLSPDGIYSRRIDRVAKFHLEGLEAGENQAGVLMPFEADVYCEICGHRKHLKAGEPIPMCCGKPMTVVG